MSNNFKIGMQYLLPKHFITRAVGKLAAAKLGFVTKGLIKLFIKQYKINMTEAKNSDPASYETFNDFFTRELQEGIRPIDQDEKTLCYPADARVSQAGEIHDGQLIQAKGQTYSAFELLGGDEDLAEHFKQGNFATLYLSPSDYHRVHMPCDATLKQMIYVPGELFSVNPLTAQNVPNLFARNERVVCIFDTEFGLMAQVLVGATIVGSMETTWAGTITPPVGKSIHRWDYPSEGEEAIRFKKGDEMGRFKLGSTVINLFVKDAIRFSENTLAGNITRLGAAFATSNK